MDLLGPSVEDLLNFCGRKFSPKTISMIMEQVLRGIEALHNHSLIHRDLKPDSESRSIHRSLSLIFLK
jgi:serine/threonine protein kinase